MKNKIVIANWKMNPQTLSEAERWFSVLNSELKHFNFRGLDLVVAPPFIYLEALRKHLIRGVILGAQNLSWLERGSLTGEISGLMLKNLGCEYVIVGHSERRWQLGETDRMINLKLKEALSFHLKPILAIGEKERADNVKATLSEQLKSACQNVPLSRLKEIIFAYEPVWAVGTGVPDSPDNALSAALIIRKVVAGLYGTAFNSGIKIIYGGSVSSRNIRDFVLQEGIDGVLIGNASLDVQDFIKLLKMLAR